MSRTSTIIENGYGVFRPTPFEYSLTAPTGSVSVLYSSMTEDLGSLQLDELEEAEAHPPEKGLAPEGSE